MEQLAKEENAETIQDIYEDDTYVTELKLDLSKGANNVFNFMGHGGIYRIVLECRTQGLTELAQVPVSISMGHYLLKTITLTGMDTEWRTEIVEPITAMNNNFFLKFYFGQSGMEVRSCRVERVMDRETLIAMREKNK